MRRSLVALVVALLALGVFLGCAGVGLWSKSAQPDVAIVCGIGGDVRPELETIAEREGVPLAFVVTAYQLACGTLAAHPEEARKAGLAAARAGSHAAKLSRARFLDASDAGAP